MNKVEIVHFNPKRPMFDGKLGRLITFQKPLNNFGDLLGPLVVDYLLKNSLGQKKAIKNTRLLTIGSILHFATDGDVIWGTGVNGKIDTKAHTFTHLDVRSVRGPLTRALLLEKGILTPEIYGDPGLLIPLVFPHLSELARKPKYEYTFIPNYNDIKHLTTKNGVYDPRSGLINCLERIALSNFVIGTSLHAIIIAKSLGIPARLIKSKVENDFKYHDYFLGTNRTDIEFAINVEDALEMGGAEKINNYNEIVDGLKTSFPYDLWM